MDVSQPLSYFVGLLKSDEHSGDRYVAFIRDMPGNTRRRQRRVTCLELICRRLSPNLGLCM